MVGICQVDDVRPFVPNALALHRLAADSRVVGNHVHESQSGIREERVNVDEVVAAVVELAGLHRVVVALDAAPAAVVEPIDDDL